MLYRLKSSLSRWLFDWQIRAVADTPPMPVVDAPCSIVSMVAKHDIPMYLLSMKSFYRHLRKGKLVAIVDRDTPSLSLATLERHFPGIRFVILEDIDPSPCQRGGTWERLVYLVRLSAQEYAIQVDCDTLVTGKDISEIQECIDTNTPFVYADRNRPIRSLREAAADAERIDSNYVGIVLERRFSDWPDADRLKYVRGSSGLSGFACGGASFPLLASFHEQMKGSLGARWRDWGTEQSGSNFVIANSPRAITLPFPAYATYPLPRGNDGAKFFHFIGSSRFRHNYFATQGRRVIAELMQELQTAR